MTPDHPLAPARGIAFGLMLSIGLWIVIALVVGLLTIGASHG